MANLESRSREIAEFLRILSWGFVPDSRQWRGTDRILLAEPWPRHLLSRPALAFDCKAQRAGPLLC